ncbi:hypothetical protein SteCoe_10581 [Stentor coeruleus]|uniref:Tyrosine-protein kinase ephrin type A/B receptor-like domain-containing protein n=1 Tax=Stentor coeruleus TaxID=5963 RepID=A0A1R2CFB3_9CILI|nr:hypothetical protein SteCoe_10581 [Stentor coeruleus]
MLIFPCLLAHAFIISKIPPEGPSLSPIVKSKATFLPNTKEILIFGGQDTSTLQYINTLYTFNIESLVWGEIIPQSYENPPGLVYGEIFLVSESKILLLFGEMENSISSDIYSFDLITKRWIIENLSGDKISGRVNFAYADFYYKGIRYLAITGGLTSNGFDNSFYLIDIATLTVRQIENKGDIPSKGQGLSLVYYEEKLYLYGYQKLSDDSGSQGDNMHVFDLSSETWNKIMFSMPYPEIRSLHLACVYQDSMFILLGGNPKTLAAFNDTWVYNFTTSSWVYKGVISSNVLFASVYIDSKIYILFGRKDFIGQNSVDLIDLSKSKIYTKNIVPNRSFPSKRRNHCSIKFADNIYIFGGISDNGEYLNDIWRFYNVTEKWEYVITTGTLPKGRELFGCGSVSGTGIIIYGGKSSSGILNDFFYFDISSSFWSEIETGSINPGERSGLCLTNNFYITFFIGGSRYNEELKDIWIYDYIVSEFMVVGELPKGIINPKCWSETNGIEFSIFIFSGNDINFIPNQSIYKLKIFKDKGIYTGIIEEISLEGQLFVSESALVKTKYNFLLISGSLMNNYLKPFVISYDLDNYQQNTEEFNESLAIFGHSAIHMGDSIYIFGGGFGNDLIKKTNSASNTMYKIQSEKGKTKIGCSVGTVEINDICEPCLQGYYYDDVSNTCLSCPAGTFSNKIAAEGTASCIPCDFGTYSNNKGSKYCYECPSYSLCPIGSSSLIVFSSYPQKKQNQPKAYQGKNDMVSEIVNQFWAYFGLFVLLVTLIVLKVSVLKDKIAKVDLFAANHGQEINVPVVFRNTRLGGIFSIYYIFAVSIAILGSFLTFELDNITEIKGLVPLVTINEQISADFLTIIFIFYTYGSKCEGDFLGSEFLIMQESNIKYSNMTKNYNLDLKNCIINIKYSDIIFSNNAEITIKLNERTARSSYISANITISSSIPSEPSNIFIPIYPTSVKHVFIGTNPSIIPLKVIPSIFYSQDKKWPSKLTGYHIASDDDIIIGETATQNMVNSKALLSIKISFTIENLALVTQRNTNSNWFIFVGGLLGSIFGLFGTFATFLGLCEDFIDKIEKKYEKKKVVKKILNERYCIDSNFFCDKNENFKVDLKLEPKVVPTTFDDAR